MSNMISASAGHRLRELAFPHSGVNIVCPTSPCVENAKKLGRYVRGVEEFVKYLDRNKKASRGRRRSWCRSDRTASASEAALCGTTVTTRTAVLSPTTSRSVTAARSPSFRGALTRMSTAMPRECEKGQDLAHRRRLSRRIDRGAFGRKVPDPKFSLPRPWDKLFPRSPPVRNVLNAALAAWFR